MNFSEAYKKVLGSGVFIVRGGAPVGVSAFHPRDKAKFRKNPEKKKDLKQIINEAIEPPHIEEGDIDTMVNPNLLALDLARILLDYHHEKELLERIDCQTIAKESVAEELVDAPRIAREIYKKYPKKFEKHRLSEVEKILDPGKPDIYTPCAEAFQRHLNIHVDHAYWYAAHLLAGAKVIIGRPRQIYYRIQKAFSRSKKGAKN